VGWGGVTGSESAKKAAAPEETATVAGLTSEGEGVVRSGKTTFVAGALPGETIRFQRSRRHRQHDEGELLEVIEPSASRVTPRCAHFGVCGGCALQHLSPEAQIEAKQAELRENFERVARVTPESWFEPMRGPAWNYRRRARLGAKYVIKKGRVLVGFRERAAPYVADVNRCEVLAEPVGAMIASLAHLIGELTIRDRLPQIEVSVADNAVALVLRVLEPPSAGDLEKLRAFAAAHSVRFYLQPGGLSTVRELDGRGDPPAAAACAAVSSDPLFYRLPQFGLEIEFTPTDFVQINGAINEALVSRAIELLNPGPDSVVLDLFCGLGNFTLALAKVAGSVVGVEGDATLVERARHNARRNGIANAEFHVGDLFKEISPGAPWASRKYTHVLLDPPRAGAREILPWVARVAPRNVVYISCHPGSLARDVGILAHEYGFHVAAAGVLDMFPHTGHVESLAVLRPR
jgi:23S rRNA (uracil1939-C5)-methyltransferase